MIQENFSNLNDQLKYYKMHSKNRKDYNTHKECKHELKKMIRCNTN